MPLHVRAYALGLQPSVYRQGVLPGPGLGPPRAMYDAAGPQGAKLQHYNPFHNPVGSPPTWVAAARAGRGAVGESRLGCEGAWSPTRSDPPYT